MAGPTKPRGSAAAWSDVLVVPRAQCSFFTLDTRGVPWRDRSRFVLLQSQQRSPYADSATYFEMGLTQAQVWTWHPAAVDGSLDGSLAKNTVFLPESVAHRGIAAAAHQLVRCAGGGVEGIRWAGAAVDHSAWWSESPSDAQWQAAFAGAPKPAVQTADGLRFSWRAWFYAKLQNKQSPASARPAGMLAWALGAAMLVAGAGIGYQAVTLYSAQAALAQNQEQVSALRMRVATQIETNSQLTTSQNRVQALQLPTNPMKIRPLIECLGQGFSPLGISLREMDARNGAFQALGVSRIRIDLQDMVAVMQGCPQIFDATAEPLLDAKTVRLVAKFKGATLADTKGDVK